MTEEQVGILLGGLREHRAASKTPTALPALTHGEGLTLARARALALAPGNRTAAERAHLEECAHCRRLVDVLDAELPHPDRWALLRWAMGWTGPAAPEAHLVRTHVESENCQRCGDDCAGLRRRHWRTTARLAGLPNPEAAVADARGRYRVTSPTGAGPLRWCLHQEGRRLVLDLATAEVGLLPALVRYMLKTEGQTLVGLVPLDGPDREGHCTAQVAFDAADLPVLGLDGACDLVLVPVPADLLTEEDRQALPASLAPGRSPGAPWTAWLGRQEERLRPALRALLGQVPP